MMIHGGLLPPALLLLLFPAERLLPAGVELRSLNCLVSPSDQGDTRHWWRLPALWLDPLRGFGGTWLLLRALVPEGTLGEPAARMAYISLLIVLALAGLCQTFTRRERGVLLAPIGFVSGAVIALVPGYPAYAGLGFALLGMAGFRQFHAFFAIGLLALPATGFLFRAEPARIGAATLLFLLPLGAGMLTKSSLEMPSYHRRRVV